MKGLENSTYLIGLLISNIVALIMLYAAVKYNRFARLLFFLLFSWASWVNWTTVIKTPNVYLDYADMTLIPTYRDIILGWFSKNIQLLVGFIATCQGLIAISMLLKGVAIKIGGIGAIIFLLAILPLGVGAGFPATLIMAIAMIYIVHHKDIDYMWYKPHVHKLLWQ